MPFCMVGSRAGERPWSPTKNHRLSPPARERRANLRPLAPLSVAGREIERQTTMAGGGGIDQHNQALVTRSSVRSAPASFRIRRQIFPFSIVRRSRHVGWSLLRVVTRHCCSATQITTGRICGQTAIWRLWTPRAKFDRVHWGRSSFRGRRLAVRGREGETGPPEEGSARPVWSPLTRQLYVKLYRVASCPRAASLDQDRDHQAPFLPICLVYSPHGQAPNRSASIEGRRRPPRPFSSG